MTIVIIWQYWCCILIEDVYWQQFYVLLIIIIKIIVLHVPQVSISLSNNLFELHCMNPPYSSLTKMRVDPTKTEKWELYLYRELYFQRSCYMYITVVTKMSPYCTCGHFNTISSSFQGPCQLVTHFSVLLRLKVWSLRPCVHVQVQQRQWQLH